MFSYLIPDALVPRDHPLRSIGLLVNQALEQHSPLFEALYAPTGRTSIAPEKLLRALALRAFLWCAIGAPTDGEGHDGCRVQSGAAAQAAGEGRMTESPDSEALGRWRIVEIEGRDTDYVDMLGPGHLQLDAEGGHIEFGAVQISLDCWYSKTGAHFTFRGSDEGTEVSGDGDADLAEDGTLTGEVCFRNGNDVPFIGRRW